MDRKSWLDPSITAPDSRVSSVSSLSLESITDSAHSNLYGSKSLHVRSISTAPAVPSYMKHAPISRKPVPSKPSSNSLADPATMPAKSNGAPIAPPEIKGTLLLAIASAPHKSVVFYLQSMLKKSTYGQIIVLGNPEKELELKQLKVDIYSLLGRIGQEVKVQMDLRSNWEEAEINTVISNAVLEDQAIQGVLCIPDYGYHAASLDIMSLQQQDLEIPFKSSVGFLHSIAKHAIPNFRSSGHEHKRPGLLLLTSPIDQSPSSILCSASCRTLLTLLVEANVGKNITIDYADNVLLPEPEPVKANGGTKLAPLHITNNSDVDEYPPPDSPTKLWALYNELGVAD